VSIVGVHGSTDVTHAPTREDSAHLGD